MSDTPDSPAPSRGHAWRPPLQQGATPRTRGGKRTRQIVALAFLFLALLGALVAWLLWLLKPQSPYFLTIPMSEYRIRSFPVNPFAEQDSDALASHFPDARKAYTSQERDLFLRELDALANRKSSERVIVHLRAHCLYDGETVYLIPGNANPDDSASWVPLKAILTRLQACPARHRLLLLDLFGPIADIRLGVINEDVANRVLEVLDKREDKQLMILCACDRGQVSLVSEELGRSIFAHYLDLGLRGAADGELGYRDEQVNVRELAAYVTRCVNRWTVLNREANQSPVLLGPENEDFTLLRVDRHPPEEEPYTAPATYPDWLQKGWEQRDQWWADQTFRLAPQEFRELGATLTGAEQRWRGGRQPDRIQLDFGDEFKRIQSRVAQATSIANPRDKPAVPSLARKGSRADPTLVKDLRRVLFSLDRLMPADRDKLVADWQAKAPYEKLAPVVWQLSLDEEAIAKRLRLEFLLRLLEPGASTDPYLETLLLRRLFTWDKADETNWPKIVPAAVLWLRAVQEGEEVLANHPAALRWYHGEITQANQLRRDAEKLLFEGFWSPERETMPLFKKAQENFGKIQRQVKEVQESQLILDKATVFLPESVLYLGTTQTLSGSLDGAWSEALRRVRLLRELLDQSTMPPPESEVLARRKNLENALNTLHRPLEKAGVERLVTAVDSEGPLDYLEMQARLRTPLLAWGERRRLLFDGTRKLGLRLNGVTQTLDDQSARTGAPRSGQVRWNDEEWARRRARLLIDLLQLSGLKEADALSPITVTGPQLRNLWVNQLPAAFKQAKTLVEQEHLLLGMHPFAEQSTQPFALQQREYLLAQWRWLGKLHEQEADFYRKQGGSRELIEFHDKAARQYQTFGE